MPVVKVLFHILWHREGIHRGVLSQSAFPYLSLGTSRAYEIVWGPFHGLC